MSWRDSVKRIVPGAFSPSDEAAYQGLDVVEAARERNRDTYRAAAVGLYGGLSQRQIVPSLDYPSQDHVPAPEVIKANPFLFGPIWQMAWHMGAIPIKVYDLKGAGKDGQPEKKMNDNHPAYKLLRAPNPDLTRNLLISGTVLGMFAHGRCGWLKERKNPLGPSTKDNPVTALWPIPGNVLWPVRSDTRILVEYELRVPGRELQYVAANDVVYHRLMPDIENWAYGSSAIQPLANTADAGAFGLLAFRRLFKTGMFNRVYAKIPDELEEEPFIRLKAQLEAVATAPEGIPLVEGGASLENMGATVETDSLAKGMELTEAIVRHTIGMPEDRDNVRLFYTEIIYPIADAMEQELERSLMPEFGGKAFPEFQFREQLQGSPEERAKLHQIRILSAQETPNESRAAENKPPMKGGDELFVPLNLVPISVSQQVAQTRVAPQKGSADGQGGSQGRQSGGRGILAPTPKSGANALGKGEGNASGSIGKVSSLASASMRMREVGRRNWQIVRTRVLDGHAEAMDRRLRGAMNAELKELRSLFANPGTEPSDVPHSSPMSEAEQIIMRADAMVNTVLSGFMQQTADEAWRQAENLIMVAHVTSNDTLTYLIRARAQLMTEEFGTRRYEAFVEAAETNDTNRSLDRAIRAEWENLSNHLTRAIGQNEVAWAHEKGAAYGWNAHGFETMKVVRVGANCRTGTCDRHEGMDFLPADVPTPFHPNCECYVVPTELGA